ISRARGSSCCCLFSGDQRAAKDQDIHLRAQEAIERLIRLADDGFVLVERGVEHHRHSGAVAEGFYEAIVARISPTADSLKSARPVDMADRGDGGALFCADLKYLHHEWHGVVFLEPFRHGFLQNRRREGTE